MSTFNFSKPDNFTVKVRNIGIVVFTDAEILNVTGAAEVFSFADLGLQKR